MKTRTLSIVHREPAIRWPDLITALQDAGFSLRQIGDAIGVAHTTVQRWQSGNPMPSIPNFEDGRALLRLFKTVAPTLTEAVRIA